MTVVATSYAKTIIAVLAAIAAAILPGLSTGQPLGVGGLANVVVLAAGALQVFNAPNTPSWRLAKGIAAGIAAGAVLFISAWSDSVISPVEWVQIAAAVVGALGVIAVPNAGAPDGVFAVGRHALPDPAV